MNYHSVNGAVNVIDARKLRKLRKLSPAERALAAANLVTGATTLGNIPPAFGAELLDVSVGYVETVRKATPEERVHLVWGITTLSALHNRRRHQPPNDAAIERFLIKLGPERVAKVLTRIILASSDLQAAE